jgi:hypothetical protein
VHFAKVALGAAADGENVAVAVSLIDAGYNGETASLEIETAVPPVNASLHSVFV